MTSLKIGRVISCYVAVAILIIALGIAIALSVKYERNNGAVAYSAVPIARIKEAMTAAKKNEANVKVGITATNWMIAEIANEVIGSDSVAVALGPGDLDITTTDVLIWTGSIEDNWVETNMELLKSRGVLIIDICGYDDMGLSEWVANRNTQLFDRITSVDGSGEEEDSESIEDSWDNTENESLEHGESFSDRSNLIYDYSWLGFDGAIQICSNIANMMLKVDSLNIEGETNYSLDGTDKSREYYLLNSALAIKHIEESVNEVRQDITDWGVRGDVEKIKWFTSSIGAVVEDQDDLREIKIDSDGGSIVTGFKEKDNEELSYLQAFVENYIGK